MERQEQDRLSRYGKLVWDFANGKTTDDILTSFFENLQSAFNFPSNFKEKALMRFPTKESILGTLSPKEYDLFQELLKRNKIWESCNLTFSSCYCYIIKHNAIDFTFTFSKDKWVGLKGKKHINPDDPGYTKETFLIPEKEIKKYIDNSTIEKSWKKNLKANMKKLTSLCHQIEIIKGDTTNRFAEIEKMAEAYPPISDLHDYVKETQGNLKSIIINIIKTDNAYESDGFKSILSRYNAGKKVQYIVDNEHKLVEENPFTEDTFFDETPLFIFQREQIFNAPISYCLVEFLKNPEYSGKQRITKCKDCDCIFSKSKLYDRQRYCPACSKKNHTPKDTQQKRTETSRDKAKKKKDKEKRKSLFDAQYQRLIESGYTEKEAKQKAEEYVIEQLHVIE